MSAAADQPFTAGRKEGMVSAGEGFGEAFDAVILHHAVAGTAGQGRGCLRPRMKGGIGVRFYCLMNVRATPFMQYRFPVGGGPSSNTWPRWDPHRAHSTAVRVMPNERSGVSRMFSFETGSV